MSLISNALKEAESKKNKSSEEAPEYIQAAFYKRNSRKGKLIGALAVAILIFVVIVGGALFLTKYKDSAKLKQLAAVKSAPQIVQPAQVQPTPQPQQTAQTDGQTQKPEQNTAAKKDEKAGKLESVQPKSGSDAEQFRDPFGTSGGGGFDSISPYQLKAVFYNELNSRKSTAIVNSSIVKIGDTLAGGAKVIDIKRENITIKLQGRKIKLLLP